MNVHVVSFDLWGTLITHGDRRAEAAWRVAEFSRVLAEFGHRFTPDEVLRVVTEVREQTSTDQRRDGVQISARDQIAIMAARLGVSDPALIDVLVVPHTHAVLRACPALMPHATEALTAVRASRRTLVLTSNTLATPGKVTRQLLDHLGIGSMFERFFFSSDLGFTKPRPEVFTAIAEAAAVAPERIVHIGNEWRSDVAAPMAAGCHAVWFNPYREPERAEAPSIARLAEVEDALAALEVQGVPA
ncbi:MAG: HAD family hydrolase [Chloroflexi bacterium]|nr:MAG: HAD family hydrolase [Chloroflexota bacterium]